MSLEQLHQYLLYFLFGFSLIFFIASFFYTTPYGRFKSKASKWDFAPLPGWLLLESPCLFSAALTFILAGGNNKALVPLILICIWQSHYFYRSVIFPLRVSKGSKAVSFSGIAFGIVFNSINGFLNGYTFSHAEHLLNPEWLYSANFIIGVSLMAIGLSINIHSDNILKIFASLERGATRYLKVDFIDGYQRPIILAKSSNGQVLPLPPSHPPHLPFFVLPLPTCFPEHCHITAGIRKALKTTRKTEKPLFPW